MVVGVWVQVVGGMWVQVGGGRCSGVWGGQWGEESKRANVRVIEGEQMGKRWGGGGELNGIFSQFQFRF